MDLISGNFIQGRASVTLEALIAAFCRLAKSLSHSGQMGWLVGLVEIKDNAPSGLGYVITSNPSFAIPHGICVRSGNPLRLSRKDFQRLAQLRAREAGTLSRNRNQPGAYYLAGYAVECALKACIAKKTKRHEFPPDRAFTTKIYTHDLSVLLKEAGLEKELDKDMQANPALAVNWNTVKIWSEESRYLANGLNGRDLHLAITGTDGVLPWITKHW